VDGYLKNLLTFLPSNAMRHSQDMEYPYCPKNGQAMMDQRVAWLQGCEFHQRAGGDDDAAVVVMVVVVVVAYAHHY